MTSELLLGLLVFAFVSSITPGPNNLMLMASGANFGFRRSIPHMLGVGLGFVLMVLVLGGGLVRIFDAYPQTYTVLKTASILYLLYLAWKIATAAPSANRTVEGVPLTFLQAAAFQWVNPKTWAMALTALSAYMPSQNFGSVLMVATVFGAVNIPAVGSWTVLGQQMARVLTNRARLTAFNRTMAVFLVASLYPVLWP